MKTAIRRKRKRQKAKNGRRSHFHQGLLGSELYILIIIISSSSSSSSSSSMGCRPGTVRAPKLCLLDTEDARVHVVAGPRMHIASLRVNYDGSV